jgi:hypothetical protein
MASPGITLPYLPTIYPLFIRSPPTAGREMFARPEVPRGSPKSGKAVTNATSIPSAVAVALFAFVGTAAVAKRAFGRRDGD